MCSHTAVGDLAHLHSANIIPQRTASLAQIHCPSCGRAHELSVHVYAAHNLQIGIESIEEGALLVDLALCCRRNTVIHISNGQNVQIEDAGRDAQGGMLIV